MHIRAVPTFGFLVFCLTLGFDAKTGSAQNSLIQDGDRVVFIGDSNTYAGQFVADLDAMLTVAGKNVEIINVGLPSETCCGLSEPDHPFPRPTVQERLDRVLAKMKPDVVVACYGMNDGIYHPFSEQRFKKYQSGILELVTKVKKSGARVIIMTPPPFDSLPMAKKKKLAQKNSKQFAWFLIYEDYDSVLEKYSNWVMKLGMKVDAVIDQRTPVLKHLSTQRKENPDFTMSGDGVHFNADCHRILAQSIGKKLFPNDQLEIAAPVTLLAQRKMLILRDAWLTETGHKRPGVKKGLPLAEAEQKVKEIDARMKLAAARNQ